MICKTCEDEFCRKNLKYYPLCEIYEKCGYCSESCMENSEEFSKIKRLLLLVLDNMDEDKNYLLMEFIDEYDDYYYKYARKFIDQYFENSI